MAFVLILINLFLLYNTTKDGLYGLSDYILLIMSLIGLFGAIASIVIL